MPENYCVNGCDRPVELPDMICEPCWGLVPPEVAKVTDHAAARFDAGDINAVFDFHEAYRACVRYLTGAPHGAMG